MLDKPVRLEGNALLRTLTRAQREHFLSKTERVDFEIGRVVSDSEQPIEFVYFPLTAVLSVLSVMTDRSAIETAVIGHEGMSPIAAFHGVDAAAEQVMVQVAGIMLRMPTAVFRKTVEEIPALALALHRFSQALFTFASKSSGCNRKHSVVQRCARWLLITHDRVDGDEWRLTHLFLAQMLGVRRSSVTIAAETLRAAGAITYTRGKIRVIDRALLRQHSCDCYDIVRSTYDRLVEGVETRSPLSDVVMSSDGMSLAHAGTDGKHETSSDGAASAEAGHAKVDLGQQMLQVEHRCASLSALLKKRLESDGLEALTAADALRSALDHLERAELSLRSTNGDSADGQTADRKKDGVRGGNN